MPHWPRHARIDGPIVMIGFGSIGKGTLPLIERHFDYDKDRFVVIDPDGSDRKLLDERGIRFLHLAITRDNYRETLGKLLTEGGGQGFCVNLSVDTSSLDIMRYCREIGALYIDTVVEPWPASICLATAIAPLIGMANPLPAPFWNWNPADPAVSIPITWPLSFTSGPPESPGWMSALVSMRPVRFSEVPSPWSLAVMDWPRATTLPPA